MNTDDELQEQVVHLVGGLKPSDTMYDQIYNQLLLPMSKTNIKINALVKARGQESLWWPIEFQVRRVKDQIKESIS